METDAPFASCAFDGIMGLGFEDLSMGKGFNMVNDFFSVGMNGPRPALLQMPQQQRTSSAMDDSWFQAMTRKQFSVYLTDAGGSEITFGG